MEKEREVIEAVGGGEASVYVVTEAGEIVTAEEAVMRELRKGSSQQPGGDEAGNAIGGGGTGARYVEPRISYDALLQFLDWNTWHRRCCLTKALLTVGLGWRVERPGADGTPAVVYDSLTGDGDTLDPVVRLLLNPSADDPTLTLDGVLYRVELDYHATGDGYLELVYDAGGRLAELYHVPARTMRRAKRTMTGAAPPIVGTTGVLEGIPETGEGNAAAQAAQQAAAAARLAGAPAAYWQVRGTRRAVPFAAFGTGGEGARSEILHLYEYDPKSDAYGMPGWVGALGSMGLDRTVLEFNTALFQNSMMAHMAVVVKGGKLSEPGRLALQQFIRDRATGAANAGRVLLIEDEDDRIEVKFEKLNLEVKDLMLTGIQQHFRDVVIAAHGVPPRFLGVVSPGQLGATNEVEGQLRLFREMVTRPRQRQLEATFAKVLEAGGAAPGTRVRFNELDITTLSADVELLDMLLKRGVYTAEETRPYADRLLAG